MVVFDTSALTLLLDANPGIPIDPSTNSPLALAKQRISYLVSNLSKHNTKIIIPTPVLAEYLVRGGEDKQERLRIVSSSRWFVLADFNTPAAVECAELLDRINKSKKRDQNQTYAKLKFDRQIIAIAKINEAACLFTGDVDLARCAEHNEIPVKYTWDLELPPQDPQSDFFKQPEVE